jgi:3-methylfumaryl-CoA hydratase
VSDAPSTVTPIDPATLATLQSWQGRRETRVDVATLAPLAAMSATLDREDGEFKAGSAVPPLWHWLYFLPHPRQTEMGQDGHAKKGSFLPPVPLPRRMWAGSQLTWHQPIHVGDAITRTSTIESVNYKAGRSGELVFVAVKHEVHSGSALALTERQEIVYKAAARSGDVGAPVEAATGPEWPMSRQVEVNTLLLFRYSALTFNGHRIHYDRPYAMDVEGYPGLVVHGPLLATLLMDLVRREMHDARVTGFSFKAMRPVFDIDSLRVSGRLAEGGRRIELMAQNGKQQVAMQAIAELAS